MTAITSFFQRSISALLLLTAAGSATAQQSGKPAGHRILNPAGLFNPNPYGFSHVSVIPPGKSLVFVAGQGGELEDGTLQNDFRLQLKQVFSNLRTALAAAGANLNDVVKLTTLVTDHNEEKLKILVEECRLAWPDGNYPVNTLIPVPRLALDGMLIEIDATAVK